MRPIAAALIFLFLQDSGIAQRRVVSQNQTTERVVGLLDLPDVTGGFADDTCRRRTSVRLYNKPSRAGAAIGAIYIRQHPEFGCGLIFRRAGKSAEEELPSQESGYEITAAVVYERRGRWFRIAVPQGSAWIERAKSQDFLPYPQLLTKRMAFLVKDWDRQLRPTPGFTVATQTLSVEWMDRVVEQIGVQVVGVTRVGNDDWIHVEFVSERCGDDSVKGLKPVEGWLPAYQADGTPSAWFYSSGC